MNHNQYIFKARTSGEAAAKLRRARALSKEISDFCSGGIMVFTGLILAFGYCLVKHQMQI